MMAIQLLGELRSTSALPDFASILQEEDDFYVIREIAQALGRIGTRESRGMLRDLEHHSSSLVRRLALSLGDEASSSVRNRRGFTRPDDRARGYDEPKGQFPPTSSRSGGPDIDPAAAGG